MSNRFDATLKETVREDVSGYAIRFGLPGGKPVRLMNVDLSTLSAATDAAIGVGDPLEEVADLNFQTGPDSNLPDRVLLYNAALRYHYGVGVRSIVILLRKKADHANLTGRITYGDADHQLEFRYEVIRLWNEPADSFLNGGIGLAPLAVLCRFPVGRSAADAANEIVRRIEERLLAEIPHERAIVLMKATVILASMRFEKRDLKSVLQGVGLMGEVSASDYYTEQGEIRALKKMLLQQGRRKFGSVDEETEESLRSIEDLERLERMGTEILTSESWHDLLATI